MQVFGVATREVVLRDHDVVSEVARNGQMLHERKEGPAIAGSNHIAAFVLVGRNQLLAQLWIGQFDENPVGVHSKEGSFYPSHFMPCPVHGDGNRGWRGFSFPGINGLFAVNGSRAQPPRAETGNLGILGLHREPPFGAQQQIKQLRCQDRVNRRHCGPGLSVHDLPRSQNDPAAVRPSRAELCDRKSLGCQRKVGGERKNQLSDHGTANA